MGRYGVLFYRVVIVLVCDGEQCFVVAYFGLKFLGWEKGVCLFVV